MRFLRFLADTYNNSSLSNFMRKKRFYFFRELLNSLEKPIKILDVGGTQKFWEMSEFYSEGDVKITLLNIEEQLVTLPNFNYIKGSATNMKFFEDKSYDVVFSNSVIEHLTSFSEQTKMADEIRRVGKRYWVQTPNYYFPFEPHFLMPFFHWLPVKFRVWLLMKLNLGWFPKQKNMTDAEEIINSIKLLKKKELKILFPEAKIFNEKFLFLNKSFVAYFGWD